MEKLLGIGSTIRTDKEHEIVLSFLCRPKSTEVILEKEEYIEYGWFALNEVKEIRNLELSTCL